MDPIKARRPKLDGFKSKLISSPKTGSAIRSDIAITILCQGLVAFAQFAQYRIVRSLWGLDALSGFTLVYRVRSAWEWVILLLVPLALARQMSAAPSVTKRTELAIAGFGIGLILYTATVLLLLCFPQRSADLLFGSGGYADWIPVFCALLGSYCVFMLTAGLLRGLFRFKTANFINIVSIALVPPSCLLLARNHDVRVAIILASAASASVTLAALGWVLIRGWLSTRSAHRSTFTGVALASRSLLVFGVPRLLTLAFSALFTICLPWLVARSGEAKLLVHLNLMLALLSAAASITSPIGFVLLPHFSRSLALEGKSKAAVQLRSVCSATLFVGIIASFLALALIPYALVVLVGESDPEYVAMITAVAMCMPAFLLVDVLRSPMDAASPYPLNAVSYCTGFLGTAGLYFWLDRLSHLPLTLRCAIALVGGYIAAASACSICAARAFEIGLFSRKDIKLAGGWIVVMGVWICLSKPDEHLFLGPGFAIAGAALAVLYVWRSQPNWLSLALRRNRT